MIAVVLAAALLLGGPQSADEAAPVSSDAPSTDAPRTAAEISGYRRTSRNADVARFLEALDPLPHGARLERFTFGRSGLGRPLVAVTATLGDSEVRPNVLVNANIHGGEVEGKEAVQRILREIALGEHADVLSVFDVTFVPVFNADGNDAIHRRNRVTQNGPDGGVGRRETAAGLDLNRDFVKLETSEVRALLGLANRLDPIAFFDLHTTNGSPHGYHLTYATSLSPNAGPALDALAREDLLPAVRAELEARDGLYVFDYGNFEYPDYVPGSGGERGDPVAWSTYDARPRFGTNLMGLRGTLAILSEAYSYLPFEERVTATHAFTVECLRKLAERKDALLRARTLDRGPYGDEVLLGVDARLIEGPLEPVRVSSWESVEVDIDPHTPGMQPGTRHIAAPRDEARDVQMRVRRAFEPGRTVSAGRALAVRGPSEAVRRALALHLGEEPLVLEAPLTLEADVFVVGAVERADRPFQGHRTVRVNGRWESRRVTLPAGTLLVESTRLTAHLLHPESDDSLGTWGAFDEALARVVSGAEAEHPVIRLPRLPVHLRDR